MPTEVLTQLRALREGIAESLRKDPRFLTLSALDKSIAEITGVLSSSGLLPPEPAQPPSPLHFSPPAGAPPAAYAQPAAAPYGQPAAAPYAQPAPAYAPPAAAPHAREAAPYAAPAPAAPYAPASPGPAPRDLSAAVPQQAAPPPAPPPVAPAPAPSPAAPGATPAAAPAAAATPAEPARKKKKSILTPVVGAVAALAAVGAVAEVAHLAQGKMGKAGPGAKEPGDEPETPPATPESDTAGTGSDGAALGAGDGVIPDGKASGYVPMQAKPDAPQYQPAVSVKFGKLPNKVDLRPLMTAVEDQGDTSSCVANAVAGAYEYWIKRATKNDDYNVSRLYVYYNARWRDGSQDKDGGSVIQLAMEGLAKFGACDEKVWPFDKNLVVKKPGADSYENGAPWKVQDMAQVPLTLEAWKQALAEGKPIVFGIALFDSFDNCSKRGGVVEMPTPEDVARSSHSGHSMCAVGYSDTEKVFIVRNSWGKDWGDKGYCYMPYAYVLNPKFNDGDSWVFVPKVPLQPPREVWLDDTKPVTNDGRGVDFIIERFKIDDYKHVVFNYFDRVRKPFNTFIGQDFSEYVSFAEQRLWSSMEHFDYRSFLASTVALTGVVAATSAIASEFSSTTSTDVSSTTSSEVSSLLETSEESEDDETDEDSEDEDSDEDDSDDEDSDEEADEEESDDESEEDSDEDDSDDDAESDEDDESDDSDEGDDAEEDSDESDEDDESEDDDSEEDQDEDGESDEDSDESDDADEDESSDDDEDESDESEDDDSDEDGDDDEESDDESDDDESDDDESDDDSGDDDGGDDDGGGDEGGDDGDD